MKVTLRFKYIARFKEVGSAWLPTYRYCSRGAGPRPHKTLTFGWRDLSVNSGMLGLEDGKLEVTDYDFIETNQVGEKNVAVKKTAGSMLRVEEDILRLRGMNVMLDSDLALLYGVSTARLNEQVKRNLARFPQDFMFPLTKAEFESLRSQFATSKNGRGGRRKLPYAFTEHGAIMLASVLNSHQAVDASIFVVRAFVRLREAMLAQKEIARKLAELERKYVGHDADIKGILNAIRQLIATPNRNTKKIGFDAKR